MSATPLFESPYREPDDSDDVPRPPLKSRRSPWRPSSNILSNATARLRSLVGHNRRSVVPLLLLAIVSLVLYTHYSYEGPHDYDDEVCHLNPGLQPSLTKSRSCSSSTPGMTARSSSRATRHTHSQKSTARSTEAPHSARSTSHQTPCRSPHPLRNASISGLERRAGYSTTTSPQKRTASGTRRSAGRSTTRRTSTSWTPARRCGTPSRATRCSSSGWGSSSICASMLDPRCCAMRPSFREGVLSCLQAMEIPSSE